MTWSPSQRVGRGCNHAGMGTAARWTEALGVRVVTADLGNMNGAYLHDHRAVLIDGELGPVQRHSTLMHELGHAFHEHELSTARTEREASEWAARAMIRYCDFLYATRCYEDHRSVASTLGVLPRDVVNYQQWLTRTRRPAWGKKTPANSC